MYNPNRGNNRFGGGGDFRRQGFGRRGSSDREMHRTTCSKCGNDCEVPFRPTGERPVYCSKCFENMRSSDSRRSDDRDSRGKYNNYSENRNDKGSGNNEGQFKKQFESLNWKLDKILKILNPVVTPEVIVVDKKLKHSEMRNPEPSRVNIGSGSRAKKSPKKIKEEKSAVVETP